jgi:hypothetical protein
MNLIVMRASLLNAVFYGERVLNSLNQQLTSYNPRPLFHSNPAAWRALQPVKAAALYYQRSNNTLF